MEKIKQLLRKSLIFLHLDLTQNLKYDRLTVKILKTHLKSSNNCIDVGCHKGEILDLMLRFAPKGKHFAFEPIPYLYNDLVKKYEGKATVYPYALSDIGGGEKTTTFNLVKNAPAYSGIKKRHYDIANPEIEEIVVGVRTMDEIIGNEHIDLIKIDVEGGEFGVLKGGRQLLKRCKPLIIFECGKGASDYYGTVPSEIYKYITEETGLDIYTLDAYIKGRRPLSVDEFTDCFEQAKEYYYVAFDGRR